MSALNRVIAFQYTVLKPLLDIKYKNVSLKLHFDQQLKSLSIS